MGRPGIMLYFDILEPIKVLPDADKGRLLVAILEYGQSGTLPEFEGMLAMAWGFIQPKLDRDEESYENAKVQRKYAAFCKRRSGMNLPKIPFEDWLSMDANERQRMSTTDNEPLRAEETVNGRYPTTTTPSTAPSTLTPPTTSNSTTPSTAAAAVTGNTTQPDFATAAARDSYVDIVGGELGKGVVALSNTQVSDLLDKMGIDTFDYYVEKLAKFIIKNDAQVKNHYETILKWWREDGLLHGSNG